MQMLIHQLPLMFVISIMVPPVYVFVGAHEILDVEYTHNNKYRKISHESPGEILFYICVSFPEQLLPLLLSVVN